MLNVPLLIKQLHVVIIQLCIQEHSHLWHRGIQGELTRQLNHCTHRMVEGKRHHHAG